MVFWLNALNVGNLINKTPVGYDTCCFDSCAQDICAVGISVVRIILVGGLTLAQSIVVA